jgi:TldD protein
VPDHSLGSAHRWGVVSRSTATVLLSSAIAHARDAGAEFCDVRLSETEEMRLYAVSGVAPDERIEGHAGIGVRVLVNGVWGFASRPLRDEDDAKHVVASAIANARAAKESSSAKVVLPEREAENGFYQTDADIDPFAVASSTWCSRALALRETSVASCACKRASTPSASIDSLRTQKGHFRSSTS